MVLGFVFLFHLPHISINPITINKSTSPIRFLKILTIPELLDLFDTVVKPSIVVMVVFYLCALSTHMR